MEADAILRAAGTPISSLLIQEAKTLYAVREKVDNLCKDLGMMRACLRDVDANHSESEVIREFILSLTDLGYEAEDIIEKYTYGVTHRRGEGISNTLNWVFCGLLCNPCDMVAHHMIGSEIDALRGKLSDLRSSLQSYISAGGGSNSSMPPNMNIHRQQRKEVPLHMLEDDPIGLDGATKCIVDEMIKVDTYAKFAGISGMGGVGKSTLAKKVYNDKTLRKKNFIDKNLPYGKEKRFERFAWVYVSQQFKETDVWRKILLKLYEKSEMNKNKIRKLNDGELSERLDNELQVNRCLVVLDDLWTIPDWDQLKSAFGSIRKSESKILITTRSKELLRYMDPTGYLHELQCLNDQESWQLFERRINAVRQFNLGPHMKSLGEKMVKNCKGLPLAIVTLSGILADKTTINDWEEVSEKLNSYLNSKSSQKDSNLTVSEVLELSYYDLPHYLKPCFLYMASFPEDFEISVDKLRLLWEAEGLLEQYDTTMTLESMSLSYLNELAGRYLILLGKTTKAGKLKSCSLHDIVRDMLVTKARKENFFHVTEGGQQSIVVLDNRVAIGPRLDMRKRRLHRFAIHHPHEFINNNDIAIDQLFENWTHLRSLIIFTLGKSSPPSTNLVEIAGKAFLLLRVLNLEGVEHECISKLPAEIGDLIFLRYMSLKDSYVKKVPASICQLKWLLTLDLRVKDRLTIPNSLFSKIKRLKHLYLPEWHCEVDGLLKLSGLSQLETLVNFPIHLGRIEDLNKLTRLKKFSVSQGSYAFNSTTKDIKLLLSSPAIQSFAVKKPFPVVVPERVLPEMPSLLEQLASTTRCDFSFYEFLYNGRIPESLMESTIHPTIGYLVLHRSTFERDPLPVLERLPQLKCLCLHSCLRSEVKEIVCSRGGFPRLITLVFCGLSYVEEWRVDDRAMSNLIRLSIDDDCPLLVEKVRFLPSELLDRVGGLDGLTNDHITSSYMKDMQFRRWVTK